MTDYTILSRFRNKAMCESLIERLREKGKTCYNFCASPADPAQPDAHPEEQMKVFEGTANFFDNEYFRHLFETDLQGLKNAEKIILLLPAGLSAHMEAGIAFGLGKHLILIGEPEKPESLYLMFQERYATPDDFLESVRISTSQIA